MSVWTTSYRHYDAVESTRELTDEAEQVADAFAYDAWGTEIAGSGTVATPFTWNGAWGYCWEADARLFQVRARPYRPGIARFLAADPLWPADGLNRFTAVRNNPLNLVDPTGLLMCKAPECSGGCVAGQDTKVKSCTIDKLVADENNDRSCSFVTRASICSTLTDLAEKANKKFPGMPWVYNFCEPKENCKCEPYELDPKKDTIVLKDEVIERTEDVPIIGKVHCIFTVSGTIKLAAGSLALAGCVPAKKQEQ